jgi:5-methylcytosine-specific restriction endonuclease McrA
MLRDNEAKVIRGYREKDSIVWPDGREKLVGRDWKARKLELWTRSGGRCEGDNPHGRCLCRFSLKEMHPHHKVKRSVLRDDRIENLEALCFICHDKRHADRKPRFHESLNDA